MSLVVFHFSFTGANYKKSLNEMLTSLKRPVQRKKQKNNNNKDDENNKNYNRNKKLM